MVFTFPATVLISHLKAALRFISTDLDRPHLSCMRIEAHPKEIRFVATDGYRMWIAGATPASGSSSGGTAHISRWDVQRLATKVIDRKSGSVSVNVESPNVTITQGTHITKFDEAKFTDEQYPAYTTHILPVVSEDKPRVAVAVSSSYLADAAASFADVCDPDVAKVKGPTFRVLPGETPFAPVLVTQEGNNALVLIMPTSGESYADARVHVNGLIERYKEQPIPSRRKASAG